MKTQNYRYLLCMAVALLAACSDAGKGKESEEGVATVLPSESNEVTVKVLKQATFEHELVSNGKVTAGAMADLRFETTGVVAHIYVKNGAPVRKGQKLAELDKFRLKNKTAQAKDALDKAELELQDVLIGQGYPVGDASKVPADIMKLARVRSGYDQSLAQYELAAYEEEHATLVAPFDGVVANLFSKPFNEASTSEAFCSIIGTQGMEVDFTVLESELPLIKSGDKVIVTPYSDAGFRQEGRITQINPLVDDKGMVKVKAAVNGKGRLFSGMNVRVNVHRSGRTACNPEECRGVAFGQAGGVYPERRKGAVELCADRSENAESYSMADDALKEGDTVIVTGNVNLAHEASVKVVDR